MCVQVVNNHYRASEQASKLSGPGGEEINK